LFFRARMSLERPFLNVSRELLASVYHEASFAGCFSARTDTDRKASASASALASAPASDARRSSAPKREAQAKGEFKNSSGFRFSLSGKRPRRKRPTGSRIPGTTDNSLFVRVWTQERPIKSTYSLFTESHKNMSRGEKARVNDRPLTRCPEDNYASFINDGRNEKTVCTYINPPL
jgi:hypothetical protein